MTREAIGVTTPADSEGERPGGSAAATGRATSGNALHADSSSLHPGGLHPAAPSSLDNPMTPSFIIPSEVEKSCFCL
ncbi:MAG: hypothetical protein M3Y56_00320 [Armatimonadota bacterium]|nr:hypothetical protein [Armatimonadota bacterium]